MTQKVFYIEDDLDATLNVVREQLANGWRMAFAPALAATSTQYYSHLYGVIVLESPEDSKSPHPPYEFIGLLAQGMQQKAIQLQREGREMGTAAQMVGAANYLTSMRARIVELEAKLEQTCGCV
jgi:hypothetical protein